MEGNNVLQALTSTVDSLGTLIIELIGDFISLIIANPYLMIGVSLMLIGAGVSFLKRLIRV